MENFLERLLKEKDELGERVGKLSSFLKSDKIMELDSEHQTLLKIQYQSMKLYYTCILERLVLINKKGINKENKEVVSGIYVIPYGKYKGYKLENIPAKYLLWKYENDGLDVIVHKYVKEQLELLRNKTKG